MPSETHKVAAVCDEDNLLAFFIVGKLISEAVEEPSMTSAVNATSSLAE